MSRRPGRANNEKTRPLSFISSPRIVVPSSDDSSISEEDVHSDSSDSLNDKPMLQSPVVHFISKKTDKTHSIASSDFSAASAIPVTGQVVTIPIHTVETGNSQELSSPQVVNVQEESNIENLKHDVLSVFESKEFQSVDELFKQHSQKLYFSGFCYMKACFIENTDLKWNKYWFEVWGHVLMLWQVPDEIAATLYNPVSVERIIAFETDPLFELIEKIKLGSDPVEMNLINSLCELAPSTFSPSKRIDTAALPPLPYSNFSFLNLEHKRIEIFAFNSIIQANSFVAAVRLCEFEWSELSSIKTNICLAAPAFSNFWKDYKIEKFDTLNHSNPIYFETRLLLKFTFCSYWHDFIMVITTSPLSFKKNKPDTKFKLFKKKEESEDQRRPQILFYANQKDFKKGEPSFYMPSVRSIYSTSLDGECILRIDGPIQVASGIFPESEKSDKNKSKKVETAKKTAIVRAKDHELEFGSINHLVQLDSFSDLRKPSPHFVLVKAKSFKSSIPLQIGCLAAFNIPFKLQEQKYFLDPGFLGKVNYIEMPLEFKNEFAKLIENLAFNHSRFSFTSSKVSELSRDKSGKSSAFSYSTSLKSVTNQPSSDHERSSSEESMRSEESNHKSYEASVRSNPNRTNSTKSKANSESDQIHSNIYYPQQSSNMWGNLFLSLTEVEGLPMFSNQTGPDDIFSSCLKSAEGFSNILDNKVKFSKLNTMQDWKNMVVSGVNSRKAMLLQQIAIKSQELFKWIQYTNEYAKQPEIEQDLQSNNIKISEKKKPKLIKALMPHLDISTGNWVKCSRLMDYEIYRTHFSNIGMINVFQDFLEFPFVSILEPSETSSLPNYHEYWQGSETNPDPRLVNVLIKLVKGTLMDQESLPSIKEEYFTLNIGIDESQSSDEDSIKTRDGFNLLNLSKEEKLRQKLVDQKRKTVIPKSPAINSSSSEYEDSQSIDENVKELFDVYGENTLLATAEMENDGSESNEGPLIKSVQNSNSNRTFDVGLLGQMKWKEHEIEQIKKIGLPNTLMNYPHPMYSEEYQALYQRELMKMQFLEQERNKQAQVKSSDSSSTESSVDKFGQSKIQKSKYVSESSEEDIRDRIIAVKKVETRKSRFTRSSSESSSSSSESSDESPAKFKNAPQTQIRNIPVSMMKPIFRNPALISVPKIIVPVTSQAKDSDDEIIGIKIKKQSETRKIREKPQIRQQTKAADSGPKIQSSSSSEVEESDETPVESDKNTVSIKKKGVTRRI